MELSRRSVFSFLGIGVATAHAESETKSIRPIGDTMPVDIQKLPKVAAPTPPNSPNLGRNKGVAFGVDPIDTERLAEAVALLRSIGFVTCSIDMTVRREDYSKIHIELGQIRDPRIS